MPSTDNGAGTTKVQCSRCRRHLPQGDSFLGCKLCQLVSCDDCTHAQSLHQFRDASAIAGAAAASAGNDISTTAAAAAADHASRKVVETRPSWPPHRAVSPSPSSVFSPPGVSPSTSLARGSSVQSSRHEDPSGVIDSLYFPSFLLFLLLLVLTFVHPTHLLSI